MIRIAQVLRKMDVGGVEAVVMDYYRNIDRSRIQYDFIVDERSGSIPRGEIESLGGNVMTTPPMELMPAHLSVLESLFRAGKYPIVHAHMTTLSTVTLGAAERAGVPVRIAHAHGVAGDGEPLRSLVKGALRHTAKKHATHLMACGRQAGDWLFGEGADYQILRNAIDLNLFKYDALARAEVRRDFGILEDTFVVGHVGRFVTSKNHSFLIDVFSRVHEILPDSLMVLVGDGRLLSRAKRLVKRMGIENSVVFPGNRGDVHRLYQAFDVFAFPSLHEGFGLAVAEAQRSGLPCIISERVPPEAALTNLVRALPLSDGIDAWAREIVDAAGRRKVRHTPDDSLFAGYDIRDEAKRLVQIYESLASG